MYVYVASRARGWRRVEIDFVYRATFFCRFVAAIAGDFCVGACQWKWSLRMVESFDVGPGTDVVAGFASERFAIRSELGHAITKLPLVRIGVAACARKILKAEWSGLCGML